MAGAQPLGTPSALAGSFYLSQKIDLEIVHLVDRWRSLTYEAYICAFEQIASLHLGNALNRHVEYRS